MEGPGVVECVQRRHQGGALALPGERCSGVTRRCSGSLGSAVVPPGVQRRRQKVQWRRQGCSGIARGGVQWRRQVLWSVCSGVARCSGVTRGCSGVDKGAVVPLWVQRRRQGVQRRRQGVQWRRQGVQWRRQRHPMATVRRYRGIANGAVASPGE